MSHRPASEKKGNARSPRIPSWKWPWTRGWGRHGTPARCPTSPAAAHSPAAQRRRTARRPKGVRGGRGSCPPRSGGRGMAAVSGAQWARNISFYNDRYIYFFFLSPEIYWRRLGTDLPHVSQNVFVSFLFVRQVRPIVCKNTRYMLRYIIN